LVVIPDRPVDERSKLSPFEALELTFLSIVAGKLLKRQHGAAWINYQENGNWQLDTGKERILHLHVYGRSKSAKSQQYGEALSFPLRKDLDAWQVEPYTVTETNADIEKAADIVQEQWAVSFYKALEALGNGRF
jgi:diadenosine tetraphosphate (Ap4A) HIT family hydrolase